MKIGIINYGIGNLGSIRNMGRRVGLEIEFIESTQDLDQFKEIILPELVIFEEQWKLFESRVSKLL